MEYYFSAIFEFLTSLPSWSILVPPACALVSAIPLFVFRKRKAYLWFAAVCFVVGVLLSLKMEYRILYLALFAGLILLPLPFFFLPKKQRDRESSEERLYRKFCTETDQLAGKRELPPKVCCFEEPRGETPEERGMKLSHVITLLERLKREKLTPADRLEVEMLSRTVTGAESRPLTDSQTDELSDSLSAVLRLTAKYS